MFNAASYVTEAINAACEQTHESLELIVVDDGSTDGSAGVVKAITDPRVRYVFQSNQGQSAAINYGVSLAKGHWIKLLDADDWINPEHIACQVQVLNGRDDAVASCRWGYFSHDFRNPAVRTEHTNASYEDPLQWIVDSLTRDEGMMGGWMWLIPRKVWDRAGGYDPRLSLNNDFHASIAILLASNGVRFAADAIYSYRRGLAGSLSRGRSRKAMESALLTTELGCSLMLQREDSPRIRAICARRFQRWVYDFFPDFPDLTDRAESAAQQLGGADLDFPGGKFAQKLSKALGWRTVRRLQSWAMRLGWGHVQRIKQNRRLQHLP